MRVTLSKLLTDEKWRLLFIVFKIYTQKSIYFFFWSIYFPQRFFIQKYIYSKKNHKDRKDIANCEA